MPAASRARWLWRDQPQPERRQLRAFYRALEVELGPFSTHLARAQARMVSEAWVQATAASGAAITVMAQRRHGRGRRPDQGKVNTQQKRSWSALDNYRTALADLRALVGSRQPSVAELLRRVHGEDEEAERG